MISTLDLPAVLRAGLIFLHLLFFSAAVCAIIMGDVALFAKRRVNAILLRLSARWVTICLSGLWLSGAAIVGLDTHFDPELIAQNGKLLTKLTVVLLLTLNGVLLHRFAFPQLLSPQPNVIQSALAPALLGGASAATWGYAAFIGVAKPFSPLGYGGLMTLYAGVLIVALIVAGVFIRPRLARQLSPARANRVIPSSFAENIAMQADAWA